MSLKQNDTYYETMMELECIYCGYPKKGYDHISCETEDMRGCHEVEFQHELAREMDGEAQFEFERGN